MAQLYIENETKERKLEKSYPVTQQTANDKKKSWTVQVYFDENYGHGKPVFL